MATGRQNRGAIAVLAILAITFCAAFYIREIHISTQPSQISNNALLSNDSSSGTQPDTTEIQQQKPRKQRKKSDKKKRNASKSRKPKYQPDKRSPLSDPVPRQL